MSDELAALIRRVAPHVPEDVWGITHGRTAQGDQVMLLPILEARLALMQYEWAWWDAFCRPEGTT